MLSQHRKSATGKEQPLSPSEIEKEGKRLLLKLFSSEPQRQDYDAGANSGGFEFEFEFTSADTTSLLSYLANPDCCKSERADISNGNGTTTVRDLYGSVVRQSCTMILQSNTDPKSTCCSAKTARRIASNGLLPLASSLPLNDTWADALIRSLVALILPTAVIIIEKESDCENDGHIGDTGVDDGGREINTVGLDVLLPSYLARLHSTETMESSCLHKKTYYLQQQTLPPSDDDNTDHVAMVQDETSSIMSVDNILNAMCCCATEAKYMLRPTAAAAVTSSLKEFESILPNRLVQILDQKATVKGDDKPMAPSSINSTSTTDIITNPRKRKKESKLSLAKAAYNRISSLIQTLLSCLHTLAQTSDWDSIPPLVYQLCLFVTKVPHCDTVTDDVLIGIADLFNNLHCAHSSSPQKTDASGSNYDQEALSWATRTSLTHLCTILRSDPILPQVLLKLLKGQSAKLQTAANLPFRYMCMTPFKMAMGLTMAYSIPRMRTRTLECLRDLVVEEELIRQKRFSSVWFNACAAVLVTGVTKVMEENTEKNGPGNVLTREVKKYVSQDCDNHCVLDSSHMFQCMQNLISMVDGNEPNAEDSALDQSLVSLGFLLIDSVGGKGSSAATACKLGKGAFVLPPLPSCATILLQNSTSTLTKKAHTNVSKIGRALLTHLFIKAWKVANEENVFGSGGYSGSLSSSAPLCRSILLTASEKFCGMAPNALEHSYILRDMACCQKSGQVKCASPETTGADILGEAYLPVMIDFLSHIPGGGMPPVVAMISIIPALGSVLHRLLRVGRRNINKRDEVEDQIDHCFILAKKALFCTDVERRYVAVNILTTLLSLAIEKNVNETVANDVTDEIQGYLRRCLTQHQAEVRMEVYASLVELMPSPDEDGNLNSNSTAPNLSPLNAKKYSSVCHIFSQILSSHLERYITVVEDVADLEARRRRAIMHGSQLSQCADLLEEEGRASDYSLGPPLRLELCVTSGHLSSNSKPRLGNNAAKKSQAISSTILCEALARITEPLPFLLSTGKAMVDTKVAGQRETGMNDLYQTITNLRTKVAMSKLEEYLVWCNEDNQSDAIILSCCLLVASVAESLMDMNCKSEGFELSELETLNNLFNLRMAAVLKGATIVSQKPTKVGKGKSSQKLKKNSLTVDKKELDVENSTKDQDDVKATDENRSVMRPNQNNLEKSKRLVENSIASMCPALSPSFLATCLRSCGTSEQSEGTEDMLHHSQNQRHGDETQSVHDILSQNVQFRRFLLERSLELLNGNTLVVKLGLRFDRLGMLRNCHDSQKQIGLYYITCSMQLGPLLMAEFCSHTQYRKSTSLSDESDTPLSQLALRSFISCIRRMTSHVNGHEVEKSLRLSSFLRFCFEKLFCRFPDVKQRWNNLLDRANQPDDILEMERNSDLLQLILPLILPMKSWNSEDPIQLHGGLLAELCAQGLDGEAADCCKMLTCLLCHLNSKQKRKLSSYMLACFEDISSECTVEGLLGLDYDSASSSNERCQKSAAGAIDSVTVLDGLLDGSTSMLFMETRNQGFYRKCLGFPDHSDTIQEHIKSQIGTTEFFELDKDECFGISYRLAISFLATIGIGHNFEDSFKEKDISTINELTLACTRIISLQHSSNNLVSKELTCAAGSLSNAIDMGLADAEFITSKLLSSTANDCLLLMQKMLACRLYAITKLICTLAPCGESLDSNGSFIASLLKSSKRLFMAHTKLIVSHLARPTSFLCGESKQLLNAISEKFAPRTMNLLLTMQEMSKVGDGKMIANGTIESQGRVAALVVFELERRDNALFKMSAKLKADAKKSEGEWIETKVVESTTRDFKIKKKNLQAARDRERLTRKKKKVPKKEKGKKKKVKTFQNVNDGDENIIGDSEDELSVNGSGDGHISVDNATEDMVDHDRNIVGHSEDELSVNRPGDGSISVGDDHEDDPVIVYAEDDLTDSEASEDDE